MRQSYPKDVFRDPVTGELPEAEPEVRPARPSVTFRTSPYCRRHPPQAALDRKLLWAMFLLDALIPRSPDPRPTRVSLRGLYRARSTHHRVRLTRGEVQQREDPSGFDGRARRRSRNLGVQRRNDSRPRFPPRHFQGEDTMTTETKFEVIGKFEEPESRNRESAYPRLHGSVLTMAEDLCELMQSARLTRQCSPRCYVTPRDVSSPNLSSSLGRQKVIRVGGPMRSSLPWHRKLKPGSKNGRRESRKTAKER